MAAKREALNLLRADRCEEYRQELEENDNACIKKILQKEIERLSYHRYDIVSANREGGNLLSNYFKRGGFSNLLSAGLIFELPAVICFFLLGKVVAKPLPYDADTMPWEAALIVYIVVFLIYASGVYNTYASFRYLPCYTDKPKKIFDVIKNFIAFLLPAVDFALIVWMLYILVTSNLNEYINITEKFTLFTMVQRFILFFTDNWEKNKACLLKWLDRIRIHKEE